MHSAGRMRRSLFSPCRGQSGAPVSFCFCPKKTAGRKNTPAVDAPLGSELTSIPVPENIPGPSDPEGRKAVSRNRDMPPQSVFRSPKRNVLSNLQSQFRQPCVHIVGRTGNTGASNFKAPEQTGIRAELPEVAFTAAETAALVGTEGDDVFCAERIRFQQGEERHGKSSPTSWDSQ